MERYRREGNTFCIDIRINHLSQLYDNRDPAPFRERDLDPSLVKYLQRSMDEIPKGKPIKIILYGPIGDSDPRIKEDIVRAFHSYFQYEVWAIENELKQLFKIGRTSLFFAIIFLIIILFFATNVIGKGALQDIFREGLIILGWVAVWRPVNILLYEWWPHLRKRKIYKILSEVKIEFN